MKKLFYFTILIFMLIPFAVRAEEINLEEIHNSISKNNKLTIKSIPFEYYIDSDYYKTCVEEYSSWGESAKDVCLDLMYEKLIASYLYKNNNFINLVSSDISCQAKNNSCNIDLFFYENQHERLSKTYNVELVGEYDDKIYNIVKNSMNSLQKKYFLDDMGYINQLINYTDIEKYFTFVQGNIELFKLYPEMKKHVENNPNIEYIPVFGAGGYGPLTLGAGGVVFAYYDDMAVGISDKFSYSTNRIVYVSDKTENTPDAYIEAALKRIKEYINNDNYEINITYDKESTDLSCNGVDCNYMGYKTKFYKLTINNKEYTLGISPTDEKNIKKLKIESKDYKNDISVETESSDVPLDTSVKTEDLTIKYKGFLKAYDIDLYSGIKDEYITKVKDGIIVRIPLPDKYDKKKLDVYHIKEDGTKGEKYKAIVEEIDGKKYAVFTTNHFSIYAIEEEIEEEIKDIDKEEVKDEIKDDKKEEIKQEETENPNTLDSIGKSIFVGIISLIGLLSINIFFRKKNI